MSEDQPFGIVRFPARCEDKTVFELIEKIGAEIRTAHVLPLEFRELTTPNTAVEARQKLIEAGRRLSTLTRVPLND